jgi:UDP-glucose 4-epimerase
VLVTGANGFVGCAVCRRLKENGFPVTVRASFDLLAHEQQWQTVLRENEVVVHTAAQVHVLKPSSNGLANGFMETNVEGTKRLASACEGAGSVRRFIFLSSAAVYGRPCDGVLTEDDRLAPELQDWYGRSKLLAETWLAEFSKQSHMEMMILRPPLVYGPGGPGNFLRLLRSIHAGLPLPFRAVSNRRTLGGIRNLTGLIMRCIWHPATDRKAFNACDGQDISTPALIERLARHLQRPARLFPVPNVPNVVLRGAGYLLGRSQDVQRLTTSLRLSCEKAKTAAGWTHEASLDEDLAEVVSWYQAVAR